MTAGRTNEVLGARWDEIDTVTKVWTIPAGRMKAGREHRVPLSPPALALVEQMRALRQNEYLFPGDKRAALSNMALLMMLRRMKRDDLTAHGFRSTFRTWAAERTNYPREVVETALAHVVGSKVEAAYQRGDMFEKRQRLMYAWTASATVPPSRAWLYRCTGLSLKSRHWQWSDGPNRSVPWVQIPSLRQSFCDQLSPPRFAALKSPITTAFARKPPHCVEPVRPEILSLGPFVSKPPDCADLVRFS